MYMNKHECICTFENNYNRLHDITVLEGVDVSEVRDPLCEDLHTGEQGQRLPTPVNMKQYEFISGTHEAI